MAEYTRNIQALNEHQKEWFRKIDHFPIHIIEGPAGSGKTYIGTAEGCSRLDKGISDKLVFLRPHVTTEDFGFLPGDLGEKMDPLMIPIVEVAVKRLSMKRYKQFVSDGAIEIAALAYLRGRAEPLTNEIPTPNGIKKMGDLKVGDYVFGSDGKSIKITGVFPQGKKKIVKIYFTDGSFVKCSEDHLWNTKSRSEYRHKKDFSVKSTSQIMKKIKAAHANNHEIPILTSPVEFEEKFIPLDPYLLGCLLGDGTLSVGSVQFSTADTEIIDTLTTLLPKFVSFKKTKNDKYGYRITVDDNMSNPLITVLKELNLKGTKSNNKFIPDIYKFNTSNIRLEILRGLIDTDGWIGLPTNQKISRQQYYSTSETLANDVKWIVESLGGTATIRKREFTEKDSHTIIKNNKEHIIHHRLPSFVVDFKLPENVNPSKLERKSKNFKPGRLKRFIEKIEYVEDENCQCISVDSNDSLYLTSNFIVTHNTFHSSWIIFDEAQNCTPEQMKMVLTRLGDDTKLIITGDLSQSDIQGENGLTWAMNRLNTCEVVSITKFDNNDVVRSDTVRKLLKHLEG